MSRTFHYDTLETASKPTFYFVGVTTGRSSIRAVFPHWAHHLGIEEVELVGIDLPPHAPPEQYRDVVQFLKDDELSLGGLVTTHKIDLYLATDDLFDYVDPLARLMGEVSCLSKKDGQFCGYAKDPYSSGLALDAFIAPGYWRAHTSDVFIIGAGGSAIAIDWYLSRPERGSDRPRRTVVSNRSAPRLEKLRKIHEQAAAEVPLETVLAPEPTDNDEVLTTLPAYSVVINATGLGKDAPGSPITDAAVFPLHSIAWDLNYRGDLLFLEQAQRQQEERSVRVEDGWIYFIHGWTQVISEVFHIDIPTSGPEFDKLADIAAAARA
jgi:shikimate 5-dehydrogenase